jgi:pseudaminic acid synthase
MKLSDYGLGHTLPARVVAEISANHERKLENAIELVRIAARSGAWAVKFQTFTPESLTLKCTNEFFGTGHTKLWKEFNSQYELYSDAETPTSWLPELFAEAQSLGLLAFSSPFDEDSVDYLETLETPFYKIASPEINHAPLIEKVAQTGKPIILSLGVASEQDLEEAILLIRETSNSEIVVLQCDTDYPAKIGNANLALLKRLADTYGFLVGISDHTSGSEVVPIAIGAGAKLFEKHLKLPKSKSLDSEFSLDEAGMLDYVRAVRRAESVMGSPTYRNIPDSPARLQNSRSVFASETIKAGQYFSHSNVRVVRPGFGLSPYRLKDLIGVPSPRDIKFGTPILESDLGG